MVFDYGIALNGLRILELSQPLRSAGYRIWSGCQKNPVLPTPQGCLDWFIQQLVATGSRAHAVEKQA